MRFILTHPFGNANVRAVMQAMEDEGLLAEFNTTISAEPSDFFIRLLPANVRRELLRRSFSIERNKIHLTQSWREVARMVFPRLGISNPVKHETGWASVDSVYQNFDLSVSRRLPELVKKDKSIKFVYAYEDGALDTFKMAKNLGIKCIYDLPIAYWETGRRLMKEEASRLPAWTVTLGGGISDSESKLERKTREMELADTVVGPGDFVLNSVPEWAKKKQLIMSPFGSPQNTHKLPVTEPKSSKSPLRILFVGSMGQRKGLGDLFSAMKLLNREDIELIVMGSLLAPMDFYRSQYNDFTYEHGRPNDQVLSLMRSCDVFCLPSIVEGRALVMQEAMSQGLPLIITPNTGGSDLIIEGETGFLVPIRSPEVIAEKLTWFSENRDKIPEMGKKASEHAARYTWTDYARKIVDMIRS